MHWCNDLRHTLLVFTLYWLIISAATTNRTIDDTYGDSVTGALVKYTSNWNAGPACTGCAIQPNKTYAFGGTWHDTTSNNPNTTSPHSATFTFNGTAIWVYVILANTGDTGIVILTNTSFELDGVIVHTFEPIPDPSKGTFTYNVSAFQQSDLNIGEHTLVMTAVQGTQASLLLFDYAVYTFDDGKGTTSTTTSSLETSSSGASTSSATAIHSHGAPTGAIVGGIVGGLAFLILIGSCLALLLRRRGHATAPNIDGTSGSRRAMPSATSRLVSPFTLSHPRRDLQPSDKPLSADSTAEHFVDSSSMPVSRPQQNGPTNKSEEAHEQAATLRAEPMYMDPRNEPRPPASTSTNNAALSPSQSGESSAALTEEVAALRIEIARLAVQTQARPGGIAEAGSDPPPPAYSG